MSSLQPVTIEEIIEEFQFLGDWEAQCDYLIDLGFEVPDFPTEAKTEANRVHGCQSMVWLIAGLNADQKPPALEIHADSDAMIVRGLIAVLLALYSGKTPEQILEIDPQAVFAQLGLNQHLSPTRRNGLHGMVKRIRDIATHALEK